MRVAAVTSSGACGIADYSDQLRAALALVDPSVEVVSDPAWLDPEAFWVWLNSPAPAAVSAPLVVWLNHHAALHARWTPLHVQRLQQAGTPVVATLHDTRAGTVEAPTSDQLRSLYAVCDATVVHEPVADLPGAYYLRQGVPLAQAPIHYGPRFRESTEHCILDYVGQPVLGTIGFNFPWKGYDRVVETTAACGWAVVLLSNNATAEDEARWRALNPALYCVRAFLPQPRAISYLSGCDATIFAYECANNGTSGAIRQGLAARKPVIAWTGCRQFRDLLEAEGAEAIQWCGGFADLPDILGQIPIQRVDPGIVRLAARDSWPTQARRYLEIFRSVCR